MVTSRFFCFFISLLKWLTSERLVFMQVHYNLHIQYNVLYLDQIDYINIGCSLYNLISFFAGNFC